MQHNQKTPILSFAVRDLIPNPEKTRILFVLESPYANELIHQHPLAGSSGQAVSKLLRPEDATIPEKKPFGCYLMQAKDERFGIINCCNSPLDISVYPCSMQEDESLKQINAIRINPGVPLMRRSERLKSTHNKLLENFRVRILKFRRQNESALIIACGTLAHRFIEDCNIIPTELVINVPHPSRNQWEKREQHANLVLAKDWIKEIMSE